MNYNQLLEIIESLKEINPKKANKLAKLVESRLNENDSTAGKMLDQKIYNYVYSVFTDCLDKKDRDEFYSLSLCIMEDCYSIESNAKRNLVISSDGIKEYTVKDEQVEVKSFIPREYKKGFYLEKDATDAEKKFFNNYKYLLDIIGDKMDKKEELITHNYRVKNNNISTQFMESLIDFLQLPRIKDKTIDQDKHTK